MNHGVPKIAPLWSHVLRYRADELRLVLEGVAPATQVQLPKQQFDGGELPGEPVDQLLQHSGSPVRQISGSFSRHCSHCRNHGCVRALAVCIRVAAN